MDLKILWFQKAVGEAYLILPVMVFPVASEFCCAPDVTSNCPDPRGRSMRARGGEGYKY